MCHSISIFDPAARVRGKPLEPERKSLHKAHGCGRQSCQPWCGCAYSTGERTSELTGVQGAAELESRSGPIAYSGVAGATGTPTRERPEMGGGSCMRPRDVGERFRAHLAFRRGRTVAWKKLGEAAGQRQPAPRGGHGVQPRARSQGGPQHAHGQVQRVGAMPRSAE